jgi:DNA-binding MarR family transcriptional regulator
VTDRGKRVLRSLRSRRTAWLSERLETLSPEDLDAIDRALEPLSKLVVAGE